MQLESAGEVLRLSRWRVRCARHVLRNRRTAVRREGMRW